MLDEAEDAGETAADERDRDLALCQDDRGDALVYP